MTEDSEVKVVAEKKSPGLLRNVWKRYVTDTACLVYRWFWLDKLL